MEAGQDNSFVSISLDGSECEICLQDTGEELTTCDICARHLTSGPVQEGFNQIPDLVHADTQAHRACFRKFHKLARRLAADSLKQRESANGSPYHRDILGNQWLNLNSNNLGSELLLENIRNRVSKSNPGSRRGSPVLTGGRRLLDQERCRSEPKLDQSAEDLRRGYNKYLFGNHEDGAPHSPKQTAINPTVRLDNSCQTRQVPKDINASSNLVESEESKARVAKVSCQEEQQYLEQMRTISLNQYQELVKDSPSKSSFIPVSVSNSKHSESGTERRNHQSALKTQNNGHVGKQQGSNRCKKNDEWWRHVHHLADVDLLSLSGADLRSHLQNLESAVNDASTQLVGHLQEKDVISSEVSSRHVTIQQLVQRQTTLHH